MSDNLYIPRRLNDQAKFLIFELDSAMLLLTGLFLGLLCGQAIVGTIIGGTLTYAYTKMKLGKHPAFALHYAYWNLPTKVLKKLPASSQREYLG